MRLEGQRFETVRVAGDRVVLAGHLAVGADGAVAGPFGKVGAEVSAEDAYQCARQVALTMIASLQAAGIDLDRVVWRKAFGMVNAAPGFNALPGVVNGFSDLVLEVFGERGRHARSAVGVAELPFGAPVEVEAELALLPADGARDEPALPAAVPRPSRAAAVGDPGLRAVDYAGISPLTLPAEALLRAIKGLSSLFWFSIAGTVLAIFLAALVNLGDASSSSLTVGEYRIPLAPLPVACLAFATFMFWLTAARLRMLDAALGDDDLTASLARDIFRIDPPVLDVFEAGNLRPFALLSGVSMLLWTWSLFFGAALGLIFHATLVRGAAASVFRGDEFLVYASAMLAIMVYGAARILPPLGRILARLHGSSLRVGATRIAAAPLVLCGALLALFPDLGQALRQDLTEWPPVGPSRANAINGETLLLEHGQVVVLTGIKALRPEQTCADADGAPYPCGQRATAHLQALVQDLPVMCFVTYAALGICVTLQEGDAVPTSDDTDSGEFYRRSLAGQMVAAGFAFVEGEGADALLVLQDEAQRQRAGAWQGSFEPPDWSGAPKRRF